MSRDPFSTMAKFLSCFDLVQIDDNQFETHSPDFGWRRIFGGQFIGQCLVAAHKTMSDDRHMHSLHSYFVRPGDPEVPITLIVDRIRDGSSFSLRSVRAEQNGHLMFTMNASFQRTEAGFSHQANMPDVPMPEEVNFDGLLNSGRDHVITPLRAYLERERPMEFRPVSLKRFTNPGALEPVHSVWLKLVAPTKEASDPVLSRAMLAYMSDALLIDTALFPHAINIFDGSMQGASLDHSVWFHRPFALDDWVLYHMDSPAAGGARGFARGSLFMRDGTLIASVAQEGLIRKRAND